MEPAREISKAGHIDSLVNYWYSFINDTEGQITYEMPEMQF
jgi:hypothetical protein